MKRILTEKIKKFLDSNFTEGDWDNWGWHLKNSITDIDTLENILEIKLKDEEREEIITTMEKFPFSATPYYISLIDAKNYINDPVYKQAVPDVRELSLTEHDMSDPLHEDEDSPVSGVTHRYPDRVLLLVSNVCSMYCRHCTRKRKVGDQDSIPSKDQILKGIEYIKNNPKIRDVLLSGGDPFLLSDEYLEWILKELKKIEHVEVIRIGTRTPVVLPQRITDELVNMLKKYQPIWINTHYNHQKEITLSSRKAINKLVDAGIPIGNQSVLLSGINDCPVIMKDLLHKLVKNRIRPYYLYQCDLSEGLSHFRTPIGKGIEIIENLIGHTSGFAIPRYVVDAPGGGGKIPVMPNYLVSWSVDKVILRNYEGVITTYKEPANYKNTCDLNCEECSMNSPEPDENESYIGLRKLFSNEEVSLIPEQNSRVGRREIDESDVIETINDTTFQHGGYNNRVYILKLGEKKITQTLKEIYNLAYENNYEKIVAKVPTKYYGYFLEFGYAKEGTIPKYYEDDESLYFMTKYLNDYRQHYDETEIRGMLYNIKNSDSNTNFNEIELSNKYKFKIANKNDADRLAKLYNNVFENYPFPINKSEYIKETMDDNVRYYTVWDGERLIGASSSEMDLVNKSSEMTDFAIDKVYRKNKLAQYLLKKMEDDMKKEGFRTLYTIARAKSFGMNKTFYNAGYKYSGTLINNTRIGKGIESMNVWYKNL